MNIRVYTDTGKDGTVQYIEDTKEVLVSSETDNIRWAVYKYLTSKRDFTVPVDEKQGNFMTVSIVPSDDLGFFQLALCEMYGKIGIHVDWKQAHYSSNKKLVKDLDGSMSYKIIE